MNVSKSHKRMTILTLLQSGASQREIERVTGVDRKTIRRYGRKANSPRVATGSGTEPSAANQIPPPRPPARRPSQAVSACEDHRAWIESQAELGRNAQSISQSISQDLVESHGFTPLYN